jgi:hypothetical protein
MHTIPTDPWIEDTTTTHTITGIEPIEVGPQQRKVRKVWHQITCSCGWSRKYVSQWRARVMHKRHAEASYATQRRSGAMTSGATIHTINPDLPEEVRQCATVRR